MMGAWKTSTPRHPHFETQSSAQVGGMYTVRRPHAERSRKNRAPAKHSACPLVPTVSFSLIFLAATCNCIYTTPTPNRPAPPGWGLGLCAGWGWVLRGSRLAGVKRDTRREARAQSMCCARGVRAFYVHDIHTADAFLVPPYPLRVLIPQIHDCSYTQRAPRLSLSRTHAHTQHRSQVGGHAR